MKSRGVSKYMFISSTITPFSRSISSASKLRVAEHVDEHVERHVAVLGGAPDVVARVLLAREGVELAADRVDLAGDQSRALGRRSVPLKNMCSEKWAIPFVSAVS